MGESALQAVRTLGYTNAGTIEFLVDEKENYYFLEMNTRLQVEHPITEEITGIDLVEQQLRVAAGEVLPFKQKDLIIEGHAIEARIYAEDSNTFYPSPGQLSRLSLPHGDGIRHELAVDGTSIVSPYYDPMIAKLVVHAASREAAIEQLTTALHHYEIEGIKSNIMMLKRIVTNDQFLKGNTTTSFIQDYYLPAISQK